MRLKELKLDVLTFDKSIADIHEKMEKVRHATYDNFRVLKATDNYIEKYLPFVIQNKISANLNSILMKAPKD